MIDIDNIGSGFGLGFGGDSVWVIVSFVLAIIGAIVGFFLFIKPDKKQPNKFLEWARDFFNFRTLVIEDLLKIFYAFMFIFITLSSFALISVSFLSFILMLTLGNLVARIGYEFALMLIMIWKNTNDINKKMPGKEAKKEKESK